MISEDFKSAIQYTFSDITEAIIAGSAIISGSCIISSILGTISQNSTIKKEMRSVRRELQILNAGSDKHKLKNLIEKFQKEDQSISWETKVFLGITFVTGALYVPAIVEKIKRA